MIQISLIRRDEEARIDEKKVEILRQAIEMGRKIRPISVAILDDGTYRIVGDGRHRCEAHIRAGYTQTEAVVVNRDDERKVKVYVRSFKMEYDQEEERKGGC
ncbi:MAG: ParB N-terminal domain-containing protein [Candidatus Latescibacteria bacterium]|nr:ParB N-terminal domain-containing protein [Candidatus Latescibacterota bacterium]